MSKIDLQPEAGEAMQIQNGDKLPSLMGTFFACVNARCGERGKANPFERRGYPKAWQKSEKPCGGEYEKTL